MAPRNAIFGCLGPTLSEAEAAFFRDVDPWGFILFSRNVESPDQLLALTSALRDAVGRDAPVLVDQEGGRVARLREPYWREWTDAMSFIAQFPNIDAAQEAMRLRYAIIGSELRAVGIDVNCAPMVDLARPDTHPLISERCYGAAPDLVARLGRAVSDGLVSAGVLPVLKHIPGHGRTALDSHEHLPVVDAPRDILDAEDFRPFRALSDLPLGMLAHIIYPAIDPDQPASQSAAHLALIRDAFGFEGLLMSDDLSMKALSGPMEARAEAVWAAGFDLALHCNGDMAEMKAVAANASRLEGASLLRHDRVDALRQAEAPQALDCDAALAQIQALKTMEATHA